jgi:ankyrin repeat protein
MQNAKCKMAEPVVRLPFSFCLLHYMLAVVAIAATASAQTLADRIQSGDSRAATELVAKGADVNQTQADGTTPLHWAVYRFDRELVQTLLRKGARVNAINKYGASPLTEAVRVANLEITGMLLEAGADANIANED